jgi:hypothetical protein
MFMDRPQRCISNFFYSAGTQLGKIFSVIPNIKNNQSQMVVTYSDGESNTVPMGRTLDALPDANVTITFPDQRKYIGSISHGRFGPTGKIIYANKDVYEGDVQQDESGNVVAYGVGTYTFVSDRTQQRIYKGQFVDDLFHGVGELFFPNGVYKGEFERGLRHGIGTYTQENRIRFTGGYLYDIRVKGEYRHPNGGVFIGTFRDGEVVDNAFPKQDYEYSSCTGYKLITLYGSSAWKRGEFKFANGDSYAGKLIEGAPVGECTVTVFRTGEVYQIDFKYANGCAIGKGYCGESDQYKTILVTARESETDGRSLQLELRPK